MRRATVLEFLFAGCLALSLSISSQFTLEIRMRRIHKLQKNTKTTFWGGFKVIDVDTTKKLVTVAFHDK